MLDVCCVQVGYQKIKKCMMAIMCTHTREQSSFFFTAFMVFSVICLIVLLTHDVYVYYINDQQLDH